VIWKLIKIKFQVLLVALVVVAAHAQSADVVQSAFEPNENGYEFNYKLSDDTERKETAQSAPQSAPDSDDGGTEAQGSYGFKSPEGRSIKVVYTGGKDGFKPKVVFERR